MNESEKRVKEVYPDAKITGNAQIRVISLSVMKVLSDWFGAGEEAKAWADAASRLPKVETASTIPPLPSTQDCIHGCCRVDCPSCNPKSVTPPAKEPAPQTFEEWWEVYRPQFDTYSAVGWKGVARAAWNAAKASSPAVAGGSETTLLGKSREEWIEHINGLFAIAIPGEDVPESALLYGWQGVLADEDRVWAKTQLKDVRGKG